MTELLTAAQMRAIEGAAMESGSVTGLQLMERAGQGVVDAVFARWPALGVGTHRAVVLCGPGNNGGDGFVIARLLKGAGWDVEVFLFGDADKLPPDARVNHDLWAKMGAVNTRAIDPPPLMDDSLMIGETDLVVDALFGTGLTRPFRGVFTILADAKGMLGEKAPPFVAVDMPSGLCSDSGRVLGAVLPADLTVAFHRLKLGHVLGDGPELCGQTVVADIGLCASSDLKTPAGGSDAGRVHLAQGDVAALAKRSGHKFDHGHALVVCGGAGQTGAARLAARGALRIGAGLVTLGVTPAAQMEVAGHVTAVMVKRIADAAALEEALEDDRITALCLGPGMGTREKHAALVAVALRAKCATVLDADALSLIAGDSALFSALHEGCVLTPHGGEFARLFPDIAERMAAPADKGPAYSKVDATKAAAKRAGCTVLFKGQDTVIATAQGACAVNASTYERAAPWLATAGSGDVLAGFITGLLARGIDLFHGAQMGAWLHTECALIFGPGLIAEDIPKVLPSVLRDRLPSFSVS